MHSFVANQEFFGARLDKTLCKKFDISFAVAQKLIRANKVKINEVKVDSSYKIQLGDNVKIFADLQSRDEKKKQKAKISDEKIKKFLSTIIYNDKNLIAIDKPQGLAVQGGSGVAISVDDIICQLKLTKISDVVTRHGAPPALRGSPSNRHEKHAELTEFFGENLQLVHRLDKDTSGILLIAKNKEMAEFLTKSFKEKTISKTYLALVCGVLKKTEGEINIPLRKKFVGKNEKVYPDFEQGKQAITNYKLVRNFSDYAAVKLQPITGRTHQLRVHCKEIGHAIIGDVKYGGVAALRKNLCDRMCLHAYKIELADYFGKKLEIKTKLPDFWRGVNVVDDFL